MSAGGAADRRGPGDCCSRGFRSYLMWVGHGVRGLGQWDGVHSPSFRSCGSESGLGLERLVEWGLESCSGTWGSRVVVRELGATRRQGSRCGLQEACAGLYTDYCASTPTMYCTSLYMLRFEQIVT